MLLCICMLVLAGCVSPTGNPPPYPQPSFEYTYTEDEGVTVLTVTVVDDGGITNETMRLLIGERVAYHNGSFRGPYVASSQGGNAWEDGVETGDRLTITNGSALAYGVDVDIQLQRVDTGEYVTVGADETPRPPETDT